MNLFKAESRFTPLSVGEIELSAPTSAAQKEIWASIQIDENATLCFNESIVIKIDGNIEIARLKNSLQGFIERHDSFRSCFTPDGRNIIVYRNTECNFEYSDLSVDPQKFDELKNRSTLIEFDLVQGPLYHFHLIKISEEHFELIIVAHHLICDGWSMAVLVNEISKIYEGLKLEPAHQFVPFSLQFEKESKDADLSYWINKLENAPSNIDLPLDKVRPAFRTYESERFDYKLDETLVENLQILASKNRLSFYHILFGAFQAFIGRLTNSTDQVIGISSALQSNYGAYDLVGHLVQMLPIRMKIDPSIDIIEFSKLVKTEMLNAVDHSRVTFGEMVQNLKIERDPSHIPLMNIIFNVDQQYEGQGFEFKTIKAHYDSIPRFFENFEVFINATTLGKNCVLECQFNKNLFYRETISRWMVEFENWLIQITRMPNQPIEELNFGLEYLKRATKLSADTASETSSANIREEDLQVMLSAWKDILKNQSISKHSNFFEVGGHSLLAMDLVHYFKKHYQNLLTVKLVMMNPTPEKLCQAIGPIEKKRSEIQEAKILKSEFDLNLAQKQAWYLQEINPNSTMFNLPSAIRVPVQLDVEKLKSAYLKILKFHPQLRTKIIKGPKQAIESIEKVFAGLDFDVYECDLETAVHHMEQLAEKPISIKDTPLFNVKIYKLSKADYILFNNFHHLVFDGWSFDIFFSQLNKLYLGEDSLIEERSYQHYVDEQKALLATGEFKSKLEKLKTYFESSSKVNLLPCDFERPNKINHFAKTLNFTIDSELFNSLKSFSRKNDVSLFNIFLSSFSRCLMKEIGTNEILIGTPLRARPEGSDRNTIGYFVNSLPVKIINKQDDLEFLKATQDSILTTVEHENIPLEKLIEALGIQRNPSYTALFQHFFSFQDVTNRDGTFSHLNYSQINISKASTHTDLDMWVKVSKQKIEGAIEYRADLFKEESISELYSKFLLELRSIARNQAKKIEQCVDDFDFTKPIHSFVEEFAQTSPFKTAIRVNGKSLSYSELNQLADDYAGALYAKGIRQADLVGVCSNRDENLIISLLALMKLGAGYVPLDPFFPDERLFYMIEHSEIKTLICNDHIKSLFASLSLESIGFSELKKSDQATYVKSHDEENTLYVIYTSGSTGTPKGVELGWRSVKNFLASMHSKLNLGRDIKLLAVTTLSFDIAVLELYLPLVCGGTLVLADKFDAVDGESLSQLITKEEINIMQATPTTWRLLLGVGHEFRSQFTVLCGGEPFPLDLAQSLLKKDLNVWNMYGPTETTVWSLMKKLQLPLDKISIGKPIHNTDVYILDSDLNPAEAEEVGEICIGGEGLAKGYFKNLEQTSNSFVFHPEFGRIYKTGDLGRKLDSGDFECLGRNDSQVKIRGYRIELGEIENRLSIYKEGAEVAVVAVSLDEVDQRLVAFYRRTPGVTEEKLREFLAAKLPAYMIPNHFIFLDEFPLTLNEKIDKKTLSANFLKSFKNENIDSPSTDFSDNARGKLEKIWFDLLGELKPSLEDNFFEVGGHSMLAVELFTRLEQEFSIELSLAELVNRANFGDILQLINGQNEEKHTICLVPIDVKSRAKNLFCFHGVGGNILNYRVLAGRCDGFDVYGIQSYGVNGESNLPQSLEEMCERYVNEILTVQCSGVFYLAGGSMGGIIALEVAAQLKKRGYSVASVIMFDTFGPKIDVSKRQETNILKKIRNAISWRYRKIVTTFIALFFKLIEVKLPHKYRYFDLEVRNYRLLHKYRVKEYHGRVDLLRAPINEGTCYKDPWLGWKGILTHDFKYYELEGNHERFVEIEELPSLVNRILTSL
ncbi:MAG: amino acid adenylation domain-containing protein [Bdellovibrionota bacterium]|nr:amino acid adenylation domain-containing protein [Bdellovibrionota bacterium]